MTKEQIEKLAADLVYAVLDADGDPHSKPMMFDAIKQAYIDGLRAGFDIAVSEAEISTHDGWHVTSPYIDWDDARKKMDSALALADPEHDERIARLRKALEASQARLEAITANLTKKRTT